MATKKQTIDTENNEELRTAPAAEESQDPASWVPPFTVRVYPLSNPKTKLLATASITIADSFAVKGFRIYDSKNGLLRQKRHGIDGLRVLPHHQRGKGYPSWPDPQLL